MKGFEVSPENASVKCTVCYCMILGLWRRRDSNSSPGY